jgi:hypothetical protein
MKRLVLGLCALLLLPSWAVAASTSVGTAAAGSPGVRHYLQTFLVSGTFTPTVPVIYVTGCAAGGGGAGGYSGADAGGGGGGGAGALCVVNMPMIVTPGTALTITIGTAGVGGSAGAVGGTTNLSTTIAGLPIGTYSIYGGFTAPTAGTSTNGGAGGRTLEINNAGATGTSTGAAGTSTIVVPRSAGGNYVSASGGGAGGGPSSAGGASLSPTGYSPVPPAQIAGGIASSTKGGGGAGGSSIFSQGAVGGSNSAGLNCTVGYGGGGGGGSSGTAAFAGGNGCPGVLYIEWDE